MKILIASDSHMNKNYFYEVIKKEKPEMVLFAGDHSNDAIEMSYCFDIPFYIVRGNCDYYDNSSKDIIELEIETIGKIVLLHGHFHNVKSNMKELYKFGDEKKADLVIFGHTHISHISINNGITYLNPGAICNFEYAIYEDGNILFKGGEK